MIIGNGIHLGGSSVSETPQLLVFHFGQGSANSSNTTSPWGVQPIYDSRYFSASFSDSARIFTALKPMNIRIDYYSKGGRNSSGTLINARAILYKNGTQVASVATSSANVEDAVYTSTLVAGDTIELRGQNTSNSTNTFVVGMLISLTQ